MINFHDGINSAMAFSTFWAGSIRAAENACINERGTLPRPRAYPHDRSLGPGTAVVSRRSGDMAHGGIPGGYMERRIFPFLSHHP